MNRQTQGVRIIPRHALEWCDFAEFSRRELRLLRQRYHLDVRQIYIRTRPRITAAEIKRWEEGAFGSVSEAFRRSVYEGLRASIIDACDATMRRLTAHKENEATDQQTQAPRRLQDVTVAG